MFYSFAIPIPSQTPEDDPIVTVCPLYPATINRVSIVFPPGCAALAHIRILRGIHQLWPTNEEGSFASDGETIDFTEDYLLDSAPYELRILAWNEDDSYDHTPVVRFGVLPKQGYWEDKLLADLKQTFGVGG
jgi:hypothetical protein